jgi:serine/threonine-protein kinase HipA
MTERLIALLDGREIGIVEQLGSKLRFTYDQAWQEDADAYPLSLSMPLGAQAHTDARVAYFLWGLLPDNDRVLEAWGQRYGVSPRNPFKLLAHVGEDCAGAVQFVRPERAAALKPKAKAEQVAWLSTAQVAERLRRLRQDPAASRQAGDRGQFSLAGAQPKTALLLREGRWGIPEGRTATTHILKPPTADWAGHAENEHFCLRLAHALGLTVPRSQVLRFEDEAAIVVERYDRYLDGGAIIRIHQEDFCQALGVHPAKKYESEGGPGIAAIVGILRQHSSAVEADLGAFLDAIAFNWLIAGTDAHAKNYGLLLGPGTVRLAPFYDMASILPYDSIDRMRVKLAMKLGGEPLLRNISARHWRKLAMSIRVPEDALLDRVKELTRLLPKKIEETQAECLSDGLEKSRVVKLAKLLDERAGVCLKQLKS